VYFVALLAKKKVGELKMSKLKETIEDIEEALRLVAEIEQFSRQRQRQACVASSNLAIVRKDDKSKINPQKAEHSKESNPVGKVAPAFQKSVLSASNKKPKATLPPGQWLCPLCKGVYREVEIKNHYFHEHPSEAAGLWKIERSMLPKIRRPLIFLGGSPGSGKRK